ncbi:MAG: PstS family phosphate ABC transporter substrate-binding protein [Solirubrobacterales bacterium]
MSAFKQKLARLGVSAGVLAGTTAAVLAIGGVTAGSALAAPTCPSKTTTVAGKGSSLQKVAQENWTSGYNAKCATGPVVKYTSTGSGPGLAAFRFTGSGAIDTTQGFIGTDDGPSTEQIENAEAATEGGKATGANPIIIPVAETSIAVAANVPSGCVITGGITWSDLNKLFNGTITTWAGLETDNGNAACNAAITRVVRSEGSGTTYQFKNYLSTLETTAGILAAGPGCGLGTWAALEKVGAEEKPNITWPENGTGTCTTLSPVHRAAGGGAVAEYVAANVNTVGYASLPDVKAKGATAISLENSVVEGVKKYGAPGKEEEEGKKKLSNCGTRVYTVPAAGRTGTGTGESVDWSQVFGASPKVGGILYPLCTLTYDVGWSSYAKAGYSTAATATKEVVADYLGNYVAAAEGEAVDLAHWYQPVPTTAEAEHNVKGAAVLAISKLG